MFSFVQDELEEKETRLESYILTISFMKLLDALVKLRFEKQLGLCYLDECGLIDKEVLEPYVKYVRDSVFLKLPYRAYKDIKERWEKASLSLSIMSRLLDAVPSLMIHMLSDSPTLRTVSPGLSIPTKLLHRYL